MELGLSSVEKNQRFLRNHI